MRAPSFVWNFPNSSLCILFTFEHLSFCFCYCCCCCFAVSFCYCWCCLRRLVKSRLTRIHTVLPFCFWYLTETLFATMDVSKFRSGRVHVRKSGVKGVKRWCLGCTVTTEKAYNVFKTSKNKRVKRIGNGHAYHHENAANLHIAN